MYANDIFKVARSMVDDCWFIIFRHIHSESESTGRFISMAVLFNSFEEINLFHSYRKAK